MLALAIFSMIFTFFLVPFVRSFAIHKDILDHPDGGIKNHKSPIPYLGGLAVYVGFLIPFLFFKFYYAEHCSWFLLIGLTVLLITGLIDDIYVIAPREKLCGQIVAAFCFFGAGLYFHRGITFSWIEIAGSFLWILTVTNAFNLIDVMDGLATLVAIMVTISFLICAVMLNIFEFAALLSAFLGALVAFFWYNKPVASMYLGDAGSLLIGGFLAVIPFFLWQSCHIQHIILPVIILAIPFLELSALILIRTYKHIPFYRGSPNHFSHYLRAKGWRTSEILFFVLLVSFFLLLITFLVINFQFLLFYQLLLCAAIAAFWLVFVFKKKFMARNLF